jgi:lysozyme family protein
MSYTDLFLRCVNVVLQNEGGYVDHPQDPGGETNYGITKKEYPDLDIKNLTRAQSIDIYFIDYWSKMNLSGIKDEDLILNIFDMGVNAGIKTAVKMVQRIVGADPDGVIGPQTTELINNFPGNVADLFVQERKKYYFTIARRKPSLQVFLGGWLNRIDNTHFNILVT